MATRIDKISENGLTIRGYGSTDKDYEFFNVKREIVPAADGWQTKAIANDPGTYEWWYSDIQTSDGDTITISMCIQCAFGFVPDFSAERMGVIRLETNIKGVQAAYVDFFPLKDFRGATEQCDISNGKAHMKGDLETWRVWGEVQDIPFDFTFKQAATPFRAGNGIIIGDDKDMQRIVGWFCPFPCADVTGSITLDGQLRAITGTGYHDHNWGNPPIPDTQNGWFWARPEFERYVVLAIQIQFPGAETEPVLWVYDRKQRKVLVDAHGHGNLQVGYGCVKKHPDPLHGGGYPSETIYSYRNGDDRVTVRLKDHKVALGAFLYDITDPKTQAYMQEAGINGSYYSRRESEVTLDLDLPSAGIKETVTGKSLHELQEFGFPQYNYLR